MIKAKKNKFFNSIFSIYIKRLLKKHFYKIHLSGDKNLNLLNKNLSTIFYANHTNWWDGFTAYFLSNITLKLDDYLMMDIEQMKKYSMFRYVGVFSVDRANPRDAVNSIDYAAGLLKDTNRCLWIFPEGEMHIQDHEPLKFYSGIAKLSEKLGSVNLQPVCLRYEFINEQRPEIFISIGKGDVINQTQEKELTDRLCNKLTAELIHQKKLIVNKQFDSFKVIFHGKDSRNKTVDRINALL